MKKNYTMQYITDFPDWLRYFLLVGKPNLTQSWCYGEAKMISEGWKLTRAVILEDEQPIALVQVWYKVIIFIKLVRVSYGPMWIFENPSLEQIRGALSVIKKRWNVRTLSFLSIAPNLENLPDYIHILASLGFYKRQVNPYESGLVDLKLSISDMRARLRKNWRRHLNASEKNELSFHISQDYSDFQWMMSCFERHRKEKNFFGHSIPILEALHSSSFDFHEAWVGIASNGKERLAGMLIAYYGRSCTPLVSWLSESGRAAHAGNFLLWNCILYAKSKNSLYFDLGGTNDATKFKMGLPHQGYQMIGEYYCLL